MFGRMSLRRTTGTAGARLGLALAMLVMAAAPTAVAAAEKPKPDALWQAFPLAPANERGSTRGRPASPLLPPVEGRSEATVVSEAPVDPSGPSLLVYLAFASLLVLLPTVIGLSGRRLYVRSHHRSSHPLWQGVTWAHPSGPAELHESGMRSSSALVGREQQAAERHPDVLAPRYRWSDKSKGRRPRPSARARLRRLRAAAWTEDAMPAIIGGVVAAVVGALLVYLIG